MVSQKNWKSTPYNEQTNALNTTADTEIDTSLFCKNGKHKKQRKKQQDYKNMQQ